MASHELDDATRAEIIEWHRRTELENRRQAWRRFRTCMVAAAAAGCLAFGLQDQWRWLPIGLGAIAAFLVFDGLMELRATYALSLHLDELLLAHGTAAERASETRKRRRAWWEAGKLVLFGALFACAAIWLDDQPTWQRLIGWALGACGVLGAVGTLRRANALRSNPTVPGLRVAEGAWICGNGVGAPLRIPIADIRFVAEATTDGGPYLDNSFIVIGLADRWYDFSIGLPGIHVALDELARQLGSSPFGFKLASSTNFASRIVWPPDLAGRPTFTYTDYPRWQQLLTLGRLGNVQQVSVDTRDAQSRPPHHLR